MITVRCFASVREVLGESAFQIPAEPQARTAADVLARVAGSRAAALPNPLLVAINCEHASLTAWVQDGDEVAFFPPVSGG